MNLRMLSTSFILISLVIFGSFASTNNDFFESSSQEDETIINNAENTLNSISNLDTSSEQFARQNFQLNEANEVQSNFTHPDGETISFLNSSFYNPGEVLSINTTSTFVDESNDWSTEGYDNSYYYYLTSPQGETWFNSSTTLVQNNTVSGLSLEADTYRDQTLNSTVISNFTSFKVYPHENFVKNVSFLTAVNVTPTVVKITFRTEGKAIGAVSYNDDNGTFTNQVYGRSYINGTHTIYLRNLQADTTYYFALNATDIFANTIADTNNGSYYTFTTEKIGGDPVIQNIGIITGPVGATVTVNLASMEAANVTVKYGIDRTVPITKEDADTIVSITGLSSATTYFFYLIITEVDGNQTIDTNDNLYYLFTTDKASVETPEINSTIVVDQSNNDNFTIQFTTNNFTNAGIYYGFSFREVSEPGLVTIGDWTDNGTDHTLSIDIPDQIITIFYTIVLSYNNNTLINIYNNNSNYFTYTSNPIIDVPQNEAYINVTLDLPLYPAELGRWRFNIQVVKNNTDTFEIKKLTVYQTEFLINNTLTFTPETYLMKRGYIMNNSELFGNYVEEFVDAGTVFSPGDNISIVGQFRYTGTSNEIINSTEVPITGTISLIYENETINTNGKIHTLPVTDFNMFPNLTTVYNGNTEFFLINFQIPSVNLYGEVSIKTNVKFPGNQSFTQVSNFTDITVKYLLGISEKTTTPAYYYTQRLAGSITVTPYHWNSSIFSGNQYEENNYSRTLSIPASQLDLQVITKHEGSESKFVQIQKGEYTWFWLREHIDFDVSSGNYSIEFIWNNTGNGIPFIESQAIVNTFTNTAPIYMYTFTLEEDFGIDDLTKGLVTLPNSNIKLKFKIVVPQTLISVSNDYSNYLTVGSDTGITVAGTGKPQFSDTTAEYSIEVNVAESVTDKTVSLSVTSSNSSAVDIAGTISFTVNSSIDNPLTSTQTSDQIVDNPLSIIDWLLIGAGIGAAGLYVVILYFFIKRK
ncbi:MAG: hypothetical protein ACW981_03340 [Candidatus Hodarchaeales archaeon]